MLTNTDDGSKDRTGDRWLPVVLALSVLCLSGSAVIVLAQESDRKHWQERFEVDNSENEVNVGKRGGERRTYAVKRQRKGKGVDVTLKRQRRGAKAGRDIRFDYDANRRQIDLTVDGRPLRVVINPRRQIVRVGNVVCPDNDFDCIQKTVGAALHDMTGEEFAALAAVLNGELAGLPHRDGIRKVLQRLIDERAPVEGEL